MIRNMFKKTFIFENGSLYDYIYCHTKNKLVLFGYFMNPDSNYYGKIDNDIIKVYCTDIVLCFLNPIIIVRKTNNDNISITIKYNIIHYLVIISEIIICLLVSLFCLSFPLNLLLATFLILIILLFNKTNYDWQKNKILNHLYSVADTCDGE